MTAPDVGQTESLDDLTAKIALAAQIIRKLIEHAAAHNNVPCPISRISHNADEPLVIVPGSPASLEVSASWAYSLIVTQQTALLTKALDAAVIIAATRSTQTLSATNPPAYVWIERIAKFRKSTRNFALPLHHFDAHVTVTLTCPLTGESLSASAPMRKQPELLEHMRRQLSERLFDNEVHAALLDTIAAAREAKDAPPIPSRIVHVQHIDGYHQALSYADATPDAFNVAATYAHLSPMLVQS